MVKLLTVLVAFAAANATVTNSGFEQIDKQTGMPAGWAFTSIPGKGQLVEYGAMKLVTDGCESSTLTISVAPDHPAVDVAYNAHQDLQGMVAGKKYRVSAKMQSQGLSSAPMIVLQCLDVDGKKYLGFARSEERTLSGDVKKWEQVQTELTVPDGTAIVRLRIGISGKGNAGGIAIIDDVEIAEIE